MKNIEEVKELRAKVSAGKAARAQRLSEFASAAEVTRLENEARLVDIESDTGRTVGIDLGVVWCPDGRMVVVEKPEAIEYEKYSLDMTDAESKDRPQILDGYIRPRILFPKDAMARDSIFEDYADARSECANIMSHMHDIVKSAIQGKS